MLHVRDDVQLWTLDLEVDERDDVRMVQLVLDLSFLDI